MSTLGSRFLCWFGFFVFANRFASLSRLDSAASSLPFAPTQDMQLQLRDVSAAPLVACCNSSCQTVVDAGTPDAPYSVEVHRVRLWSVSYVLPQFTIMDSMSNGTLTCKCFQVCCQPQYPPGDVCFGVAPTFEQVDRVICLCRGQCPFFLQQPRKTIQNKKKQNAIAVLAQQKQRFLSLWFL